MRRKRVSFPRRVRFAVVKRFIRLFPDAFMSCARGGGWQLYWGYGEKGYHGKHKKWRYIAHVDDTPETEEDRDKYYFYGNVWYNHRNL